MAYCISIYDGQQTEVAKNKALLQLQICYDYYPYIYTCINRLICLLVLTVKDLSQFLLNW